MSTGKSNPLFQILISCTPVIYRLLGYSLSLASGDFLFKCTLELFREYTNITLGSMKMFGAMWSLLQQKFTSNFLQTSYIACVAAVIAALSEFRETVMQSDFWMVLILTLLVKGFKSIQMNEHKIILFHAFVKKYGQSGDTYKHFIYNSGLDCGSFMAYSFFHGYIKYVVASNRDISSKGIKERIEDYEATQKVYFPIKKLLILQPKSLYIPPKLESETLQIARNLEEVKMNRGGVANRSYQLSVYKIKGLDWYVNVQGASPLLTYFEKCQRSKHLDNYKDLNENGLPVDVGLVLKDYIEESLTNKATSPN